MYFDRVWWGISNWEWTGYYWKPERYVSVEKLMDKDVFFGQDCAVSYPIMGAFTDWLICKWGMETYLQMYRQKDSSAALEAVYRKSADALNREFLADVTSLNISVFAEEQMSRLCAG